jgi:trans-aconitate methyltransferase
VPSTPSVAAADDRIAERWAAARRRPTAGLRRALDALAGALPAAAAVLDVGCAHGVPVARWLVRRGFRVTGLDVSARLLAVARAEVPHATFVHGDMRTADPGGPFDAVVAWDSVFHVPRAEHAAVFGRFHGWLRPGARLVVSLGGSAWEGTAEMHGEAFFYSGFESDESLRLLGAAGFDVLHAEIDDPSSRGHLAVTASRRADAP